MFRVIATHPKAGTVLTGRVFERFCELTGRKFFNTADDDINKVDLDSVGVIHNDGCFDNFEFEKKDHLGIHVIRDPRDIIVSATFYYRQGPLHERNIFIPRNYFGNKSFYEALIESKSFEEQLLCSLEYVHGTIERLRDWNYNDTRYLTVKFEDLCDANKYLHTWETCIDHLNYSDEEKSILLSTAHEYSIHNNKPKDQHYRSAEARQYKKFFTDRVTDAFNKQFNDVVELLGYGELAERPKAPDY